jgi:hypothetical protein
VLIVGRQQARVEMVLGLEEIPGKCRDSLGNNIKRVDGVRLLLSNLKVPSSVCLGL